MYTYHQSAIRKSLYVIYSPITEEELGHQEKLHIHGPYPKVYLDHRPLGLLSSSWHGVFHILEEGKKCPAATYMEFFG